MNVLTGATGFLGSVLLEQLLTRNNKVIAIKRSKISVQKIRSYNNHPSLRVFDIGTIIDTTTAEGCTTTPIYNIINASLLMPFQLGRQHGVRCFINTHPSSTREGTHTSTS